MAVQASQVHAPRWHSHSRHGPAKIAEPVGGEEGWRSRCLRWHNLRVRTQVPHGTEPAIALIGHAVAGGMTAAIAQSRKSLPRRCRQRILLMAEGNTTGLSQDRSMSECAEGMLLVGEVEQSQAVREDEPQQNEILNAYTAPIVLLVMAALYGANVPLLKVIESQTEALNGVTGPELLALRFLSACVVCVPWLACNMDKVTRAIKPGIEMALWLWLGYTGQLLALGKTSVALTAISTSLVGVTVQGLEVLLEKQPVRPMVALSSMGVLLGLATFSAFSDAPAAVAGHESLLARALKWLWGTPPPQNHHEVLLSGIPGEAIAIAGAFFFGVHVWRCNRVIADASKEGHRGDFELSLAMVQLFVMAVLSLVFSWLDSPLTLSEQVMSLGGLDREMWLQIAACGIVCTGLPSVVELFAFKVVPPAVAALIYCTIPLWGAGLGVVVLKESFRLPALIGAVLILVSSLVPSLSVLSENHTEVTQVHEMPSNNDAVQLSRSSRVVAPSQVEGKEAS